LKFNFNFAGIGDRCVDGIRKIGRLALDEMVSE
jgi:hypothetical protein